MRTNTRRGYTMVEMMLVVMVIGILVALIVTAVTGVSRGARRARVETEVMAIEQALRSYMQLYGRYPRHNDLGSGGNNPESVSEGLKINQNMVRLLRGEDHPEGLNPRRVAFMEISNNSLGTSEDPDPGHFVDAWGNAYRFMCDFNYDNTTSIQSYYSNGNPLPLPGRSVAVWSLGQNGTRPPPPPAPDDNIRSWD